MVLNNSQFPHHLDADCDGVTFVCDAKRWEVSSKQAVTSSSLLNCPGRARRSVGIFCAYWQQFKSIH